MGYDVVMRTFLIIFGVVAFSLLLVVVHRALGAAPAVPGEGGSIAGESDHLERRLRKDPNVLFFSGYETDPWEKVWGMVWGPSPKGNLDVVAGKSSFRGRSARVKYPAGQIGGDSACQYLCSFERMGLSPREECYIRYYVRFEPGFDFVKGGKLPGLVGGNANTGGKKPDGQDGWSARLMWRSGGRIVQYVYHPDQKDVWGDDFDWKVEGEPCRFIPGKWHCVETQVRLNTPGERDGFLRSWLDGVEALKAEGLRFRDVGSLRVDGLYFSTFFGGGDLSWAPSEDQTIWFDDFVLSASPIGPAQGKGR